MNVFTLALLSSSQWYRLFMSTITFERLLELKKEYEREHSCTLES